MNTSNSQSTQRVHETVLIANTSQLNVTAENPLVWTGAAILSLGATLLTASLNGAALLLFFAQRKRLRSSFNIYVANLLSSNFIYSIINGPLDVIQNIYGIWWLGHGWCDVYLYMQVAFSNVQTYAHPLIAINRMWAIMFPVLYREKHSFRVALLCCLGCFIVAHTVTLPGIVIDALSRPQEFTSGCHLDFSSKGQLMWSFLVELIIDILAVIVIVQYPFIVWKHRRRLKIQQNKIGQLSSIGASQQTESTIGNTESHKSRQLIENMTESFFKPP